MKNVTIYILTISLLIQICSTSKFKSVAGMKNSKVGHLIKTRSGKVYLHNHHPEKKPVSSTEDTNSFRMDKEEKKDALGKDYGTNKGHGYGHDYPHGFGNGYLFTLLHEYGRGQSNGKTLY